MRGRVKWFDDRKGYGFVKGEDGKEYLVYFTAVQGKPEDLKDSMEVEFDPVETPKGPQAARVRRIDSA